jgi:hypothetical protein
MPLICSCLFLFSRFISYQCIGLQFSFHHRLIAATKLFEKRFLVFCRDPDWENLRAFSGALLKLNPLLNIQCVSLIQDTCTNVPLVLIAWGLSDYDIISLASAI